jgi:hypothetical protein
LQVVLKVIARELVEKTQASQFKETARDLECDPDEAKWEDKSRKVVKQKASPEKAK